VPGLDRVSRVRSFDPLGTVDWIMMTLSGKYSFCSVRAVSRPGRDPGPVFSYRFNLSH